MKSKSKSQKPKTDADSRQKVEIAPFMPDVVLSPEQVISSIQEMMSHIGKKVLLRSHGDCNPMKPGMISHISSGESFDAIFTAARAGKIESFFHLVDLARKAALMVRIVETEKPEMASELAQSQKVWPIVVSQRTDWTIELQRLTKLGLGQGDVPFHPARGSDENYTARRWAMQAVQYIWTMQSYFKHCECSGYKITNLPPWANKAQSLPEFSSRQEDFEKWKGVVRAMIRHEVPDLDSRPEWKILRSSVMQGTTGGKGEIRGAILDAIISALKTVAPKFTPCPPPELLKLSN
jgi:hypothetical protein